ncbi:hypothetical protein I5Q34_33365 [Streptomyces sp. AV19]|uniref:hypothetical protein n=1 Tax=Streptomyces sp. AV19 TaxID=2793068 RepID=UPI0018FE82A1|nr:hypothetical protein [Streptomyces sp. AV19]MBH1939093.1 hypothetical protein [Streptomyces sp. AV19]MDG4531613.1 hypothetical protein [Streptomyces sp. AV19]
MSVGAFSERLAVVRARFRGAGALGSELVGGVSVDAEELLPGHVSSPLSVSEASSVVAGAAPAGDAVGTGAAPGLLVGPPWRVIFGMDPSS